MQACMQAMGLCGVSEFDGICEGVRYHPLFLPFFSFLLLQINPLTKNLSDSGEVDECCQS
jgi:hypothetical protein